jgi:hypothetical protein
MYRYTNLSFSIALIVIILLVTSLPMILTFDIKQIKIIVYNKAYATTDKLINSTSIDYKVGKNDGSIAAVHAFSGLNDLHYNTSVYHGSNQYQSGYIAGYNEEWKRLSATNSTISISSGHQGIQNYHNEKCQGILHVLGDCSGKAIASNETMVGGGRQQQPQNYANENCQGMFFLVGGCDNSDSGGSDSSSEGISQSKENRVW